MGIGETGGGEMGVGETGTPPRVPAIYVSSKNKKNINFFQAENYRFYSR